MGAVCIGIGLVWTTLLGPHFKDGPSPEGNWEGTIKTALGDERWIFKVTRKPDGTFACLLDVPDEGVKDVPLYKTTFTDGVFTLEMPRIRATFKGTLADDGKTISGEWTQGAAYPLTLRPASAAAPRNRPQTPRPPFPYREEQVKVANKPDRVELAGTLTLPEGAGPFPAVVLISGSGPQDRDVTFFEHKPFAVLADHLTRRGFAVLRHDDRGCGQSTGEHAKATTAEFASDTEAVVDFLKARKEIDPKRVGLIGHSEGGLIALMVAEKTDTKYLVLLGTPGLPGDEIMVAQAANIPRSFGAPPRVVELCVTYKRP